MAYFSHVRCVGSLMRELNLRIAAFHHRSRSKMIILNTIIILPLVRYRVMEYYETWAYMTRNVV